MRRASLAIVIVLFAGCRPASVPAPPEQPVVAPQPPADNAAADVPASCDEVPASCGVDVPEVEPGGLAGTLAVGAPCGLAMAYKEIRTAFLKRNPGVKFQDHIKNIGPMTKEVRDGKTSLDVFLSLGEREIATLTKAGVVVGKPVPFLRQSMQLMVQKGNPLGIKSLADLGKPNVKTVAVCEPSLTIGIAGEKALRKVGVWDKLVEQGKVIRPGQPAQAKEAVIGGKADATFIYAACSSKNWETADPGRSVAGKADVVMTVPEELYGGMFAVAAVLTTAPNPELARNFIEFLLTPEAQDSIARWGYGKMDGAGTSAHRESKP